MDMQGITQETLSEVQKAQTAGIDTTSGFYGYDLSGVVSLVPVNTPFYDRIARKPAPQGSVNAAWRAITNVNNAQPNPFVGLDSGGNIVKIAEQDVFSKYQTVRVSGQVTRDAIDMSKGYADAKAIAVTQTLMQWRILENKGQLGAQAYPLPAIATPSVLATAGAGTIGNTTAVHFKVAARSSHNYYWGGSGIASADGTVTTSAANSAATATVAPVKGAVAYDWYAGSDGTSYFYVTTTVAPKVTITAIPTANAALPSLHDLWGTAPTAVPTQDTSYSANAYNGLIASLAGDYVSATSSIGTPGTGISSGAIFQHQNGAALTQNGQGVQEIDNLLLSIYNQAQLSPTALLMDATTMQAIANAVLSNPAAVTFLQPSDGRSGQTAGASVARYINKASGGDSIDLVVDPHFFPGTIAAITERVPYPNSNISNTFESRTQRDVAEYDYGTPLQAGTAGGGPRDVWDVSSIEAFINRAPVTCGVIDGIAA